MERMGPQGRVWDPSSADAGTKKDCENKKVTVFLSLKCGLRKAFSFQPKAEGWN